VRAIFNHSSIDIFCGVNGGVFLIKLISKVEGKSWSAWQTIGDTFLKLAGFLKVYSDYTVNYDNSILALRRCRKLTKFHTFLEECSRLPESNYLDLESLLIEPIQRIPRYELLLKELVKHTPKGHPDYDNLNDALIKVTEIARLINNRKRLRDSKQEVVRATHQIKPIQEDLISPTRTFVNEGTLKEFKNNRGFRGEFYYFLFNDLLIKARIPSLFLTAERQYSFQKKICLSKLVDIKDDLPDYPFGLELQFTDGKHNRILVTKSQEEKQNWLNYFIETIALLIREQETLTQRIRNSSNNNAT